MPATTRTVQRSGMRITRVPVEVAPGVVLSVVVHRPPDDRPRPVVLAVTPYGAEATPGRAVGMLMRLGGVRFGRLRRSRWTSFEAADPAWWTRAGYVVVLADARGMHGSTGHGGFLTDDDAHDYAELIAWAAAQPWSTGAVGLLGVSYLAMSQWRVAALRPPALRAIVPWEGCSDLLREFGGQGGIPEDGFVRTWWRNRMQRGHHRGSPLGEDFPADRDAHPLDDDYWRAKAPALEEIDVPALVCASWSDQGLHTRGSLEGYERISSPEKWLFTHGRRKWETFYGDEARQTQRRFLDRYLKGEDNGWETTPRVRLEVRRDRDAWDVRHEERWPPAGQRYAALHLDAGQRRLVEAVPAAASATYDAASGSVCFDHRFDRGTEVTGTMAVRLWVGAPEADDADLFVLVRKIDAQGQEVPFLGYQGFARDVVAKGWLRASHRELDPGRSRPGRPWHTHRTVEKLGPGEVVAVDVEVQASSTFFEAGSTLRLEVRGSDGARYPGLRHPRTVNRGPHVLHTGGEHDATLLVPVVGPAGAGPVGAPAPQGRASRRG